MGHIAADGEDAALSLVVQLGKMSARLDYVGIDEFIDGC